MTVVASVSFLYFYAARRSLDLLGSLSPVKITQLIFNSIMFFGYTLKQQQVIEIEHDKLLTANDI